MENMVVGMTDAVPYMRADTRRLFHPSEHFLPSGGGAGAS